MAANKSEKNEIDALDLLMEDHENVKSAFKKFESLGDKAFVGKKKLADEICDELVAHTRVEEEIFYPAFRDAVKDSKSLSNEATVEHASAKKLIKEIQGMDSEDELFDAKVKVLSEYVNHHVKEEEEKMFPALRKVKIDLNALGMEMDARKQELL